MNCKTTLENRTSVWHNYCMNKAFKYILYPTKTQMQLFARAFGCCREVDSLALANTQLNLQSAFRNCFSKTHKKCNAFPKYKSAKHSRKSYTTNNQKGTVAILENAIRLPKVGMVKAVIHRVPDPDWRLKSATISQDSDGKYYASVLFAYESTAAESAPNIEICTENARRKLTAKVTKLDNAARHR